MASTRKKRRTKHRGNAAGMVETRGRTGRKPTEAERKAQARRARFSRPPNWRSSFQRASIAAAIFVVVAILALKIKPAPAVLFGLFLAMFYTPLTYFTDTFLYRRRQAKLAQGQGEKR